VDEISVARGVNRDAIEGELTRMLSMSHPKVTLPA